MQSRSQGITPAQIEDKIDEFEELAARRVSDVPTARFMIAAGVFASLVIPCGLPAALIVSLPVLVNAVKTAMKNGQHAEYIAKTGIFCHLLTDRELGLLRRFTGDEFIVEQCFQAYLDGMKLRQPVLEFVERSIDVPLAPPTLDDGKPEETQKVERENSLMNNPTVANRTEEETPQGLPDGIARSLAEKLQSTLIVGQPGAGKGLTIAYATRWVKQLHPACEIWAIDPKADPTEAAYWEVCDRVLKCPIRPFTTDEEIEQVKNAISQFIEEFQGSTASMKLLIFDEALAVKEKTKGWFKGLMAGFNALCSMGRSRKEYGWLVSQSPNADDYGISGGTRNVYRRVLLVAQDNQGLLANGSTFFNGKPTERQLEATGRAYFDSLINRWNVTPIYPDLVDEVKKSKPESSRREMLERSLAIEAESPQHERFYHSEETEAATGEAAIIEEIKRFLLANPEGSKPRDLAARARKPVKGMPTDDIRFYLDVMALEGDAYQIEGVFFRKTSD